MSISDDMREEKDDAGVAERVLEMRHAFDGAFAAPRLAVASDVEKILVIEVGQLLLACRVAQITRVEPDRKLVPLSGGAPGLIGLSGIRGKLVPVYALSLLLGQGGAGAPRWLALAGGADPIALAFGRLDRFVRARRGDVCPVDAGGDAPGHVKEMIRVEGASYPLLDVDAVVASIRGQGTGAAR